MSGPQVFLPAGTVTCASWMTRGLCFGSPRFDGLDVDKQRRTCGICPVRLDCLSFALECESTTADDTVRTFPIYGGLTGADRVRLRNGKPIIGHAGGLEHSRMQQHTAERVQQTERLLGLGFTAYQIATEVGVRVDSLAAWLRRHGRSDLARQLDSATAKRRAS